MSSTNSVTQTFSWPQDPNILQLSQEDEDHIEEAVRWARTNQRLLASTDGQEPYVMGNDEIIGENVCKLPCRVEIWSDISLIPTPKILWDEESSVLMKNAGCSTVFYCPETAQSYFKSKVVPFAEQQAIEHAKHAAEKIQALIPILYALGNPPIVRASPSPDSQKGGE
jgi:hypothetical protein